MNTTDNPPAARPQAAAPHAERAGGRWFDARYRVLSPAAAIAARAQAIALEQSVELPLAAVDDERVLREVVGQVGAIVPIGPDKFEVTVRLAVETTGFDAGQLLNMLFGNTSLQRDVELVDAELPDDVVARFGGPRFGIDGLRAVTGARGRPLTCSALKPQGLDATQLAAIARTFAESGIDIVKDDHGLADQAAAPFAQRVARVQGAIDEANRASGQRCVYAPSLTGDGVQMLRQCNAARDAGVQMVMIAPMVSGVSQLAALARNAGVPILAHPSLAGVARIAPPLLLGKLFRLFGADATIFPNAGGRFGYSEETCADIVEAARRPWHALRPTMPVPAGGMTIEAVPQMRERFGDDAILLIGGSLLAARAGVRERARAFVAAVHSRGDRV